MCTAKASSSAGPTRTLKWGLATVAALLGTAALGLVLTGKAATAGPGGGWAKSSERAGLALVTKVAVFGTDDRVTVPRRFANLAAHVGLFFSNPSKTVCSAFCVAPNVIATAAHCLSQASGKSARLSDFLFAREYDRKRDFARIEGFDNGSAAQSVITGNFQHRVKPPIDAAYDWALVRLNRAACPGNGIPVTRLSVDEVKARAEQGRIFQLAYHRDWTQWRLAYSQPCSVDRNFNGVGWESIAPDFVAADQMILHQCDTGGASSGSPLLLESREGFTFVGINVGTYVQAKILSDQGKVTMRERAETVANTAVNASSFADQIARLHAASLLASGSPIRALQERLAARQFYAARVDGSYGPMLKSAIEGYERSSHMPVTGLPTLDLLRRLEAQAQGGLGRQAPTSGVPRRVLPGAQR